MKFDMHYHGVYVLARAAGIKSEAAQIVATASQFVDDLNGTPGAGKDVKITFDDGGAILSRPTAHHPLQTKNLDRTDQRQVWVPFHFLPGGEGLEFTERLACQKDSPIAREMTRHHATLFDRGFGLELAGVAAHVYADTFSHYGFSGVSSRRNRIDNTRITLENVDGDMLAYLQGSQKSFWEKCKTSFDNIKENIVAAIGEDISGALGHGGASSHPDRPFLIWSIYYQYPTRRLMRRNNPETFLEGCEKLHGLFLELAKTRPRDADGDGRPFSEIRDAVKAIIETKARMDQRIAAWQKAARSGAICPACDIPEYLGEAWNDQLGRFDGSPYSPTALAHPAYRFLQAASMHRNYVLRELLPDHGLVVA